MDLHPSKKGKEKAELMIDSIVETTIDKTTEEVTEVTDRNKFKKVENAIFGVYNPDSWPFREGRYFQIHKLVLKK